MIKKIILFFSLIAISNVSFSSETMQEVLAIQKQWALIKYQFEPDAQSAAYEKLLAETDALVEAYPYEAEPLVWSAIVYSSYAGAVGGLQSITKALPAVKKARSLLLQAEGTDSRALDGSVMTTLGALYYQVPGWPLGFGDKQKAREYLEKAVDMSINGLDANYFYGDYLVDRKQYNEAISALEKALSAPPVPGRPVADHGRRQEILELLEYARSQAS